MNLDLEKLVAAIEQEFDCGLNVFLHQFTLNLLVLPDDSDRDYIEEEYWEEQRLELKNNESHYIEIKKWNSSYSFKVMESFVLNIVDDYIFKTKLSDALEKSKPFRNFRTILDTNNEYLQKWYRFKTLMQKEYIKDQLIDLGIM